MNQLLTRAALGALLSFGTLSVARAQWSAHATAPDAFGNRRVVAAVSAHDGNGLVVQCNQKNVLALAYVFPVTPKERAHIKSDGPLPVTLLLRTDGGTTMNFSALKEVWNQGYGGYVAYGRTAAMLKAIQAISAAKTGISAAAQVPTTGKPKKPRRVLFATGPNAPLTPQPPKLPKPNDRFTAKGSTLAMDTAMKVCDLSNIPASTASDKTAGNATESHKATGKPSATSQSDTSQ